MNDKKEFLSKIWKLFLLNGAKTTTMDDVAKEFSISKKTLYQHYKNKEELLRELLSFIISHVEEELERLNINSKMCPIEEMFCANKKIKSETEGNKTLFIRQLKKYYNHLYIEHLQDVVKTFSHRITDNIERGRKEGYYREDFNEKTYVNLLLVMMNSYDDSPLINNEEINRGHFCFDVMMFYLNSITTEKGKQILNKIISNDK